MDLQKSEIDFLNGPQRCDLGSLAQVHEKQSDGWRSNLFKCFTMGGDYFKQKNTLTTSQTGGIFGLTVKTFDC